MPRVSNTPNDLAAVIGLRVKERRKALRWTLERLAEQAGVSRRVLINIEQGSTNPNIGTLLRVSDALGVGLPELVEPPELELARVTRDGEGAILWTGDHGGRAVLVAGTKSPNVVELWEWSLGVGDLHTSEAHITGTRELIQVLTGVVEVTVGTERFTLNPRDAITFRGDEAHSYANAGDIEAQFALTVFEPVPGGAHR
ncbi:helix-turn-helix domain-containing protein [Agromyces albus]|uniref:XRE family transcriptional regulator n=1 Tax=Agromyces albus TaxID=205332 RepID=A0A4Q2KXB7_9MICO|nr:XRE family transcriptional regulator [Agromyces albus]RXZ70284.1 XRE family transcriptional regulator [Agromyces albus]